MKVSVIIPTFNRVAFLIQAVNSVLRQQYAEIEIIIVDDGSTDVSSFEFKSYLSDMSDDLSAKVLVHWQRNSGAPVARNLGFSHSNGDYIMFMDSDDLLSYHGLITGIKQLEESGADYVYLPVERCDIYGRRLPNAIVGSSFADRTVEIAGYHWQTMGAIYRRSLVDKVGPWNPELTGSQDWEYQARVKMSGAKGIFVNEIIGYWRNHKHGRIGTTSYNQKYVISVERACLAIAAEATEKGLLDRGLRIRLLKRLIVHAIEAGAVGAVGDRCRLLTAAGKLARGLESAVVASVRLVQSHALDRFLYDRISN